MTGGHDITIPPGDIHDNHTGSDFTETLDCCNTAVDIFVPKGSTQAQAADIISTAFFHCAELRAQCELLHPTDGREPPVKKPTITTPPLQATKICKGVAYFTLINTNLPVSDITLVAGILPPGLFFQESMNQRPIISGTPTTPGDYPFTVRITPANGTTPAVVSYTLSVLGITSGDPTDATQGTPYSFSFTAAGGTPPYRFILEDGPLPAGIDLATNGTLAGTATEEGEFNITVSVTDQDGLGKKCQEFFLLTVQPPATTGWKICHWDTVLPLLTIPAGWPASVKPAWDGVFNLGRNNPFNSTPPTNNQWYFISQSIGGKASAPDECAAWPFTDADWNTAFFAELTWDQFSNVWAIRLSGCDFNAPGSHIRYVQDTSPGDPNDASGSYTLTAGSGPTNIQIAAASAQCCADWNAVVWGAPTIHEVGDGVASASGTGGQVTASALAPSPLFGDEASATIVGTVDYKGPGCNCSVHTVITQTGDPSFTKCTFQILIDASPIVQVFQNSLGAVDTAFSLPDTLGATKTLQISLDARAIPFFSFPPDPQEIDVSATITNV